MRSVIVSIIVIGAAALLALAACAGMGSRRQGREYGAENSAVANSGGGLFRVSGIDDGVYEGMAQGYRGIIRLRLRIDGGIMSEIEILDSSEDLFVGGAAIDELQELALIYNTADLDAISGASESSEGFLAALSDALGKASRP